MRRWTFYLCAWGAIQFFDMHASVEVTWARRHTSLGAGAAERPDGAHEDNDGHESSHGDADDHRHRERFCGEQQREMSFHNLMVQTFQLCGAHGGTYTTAHTAVMKRQPFSFRHTHAPTLLTCPSLFCLCSRQELREDLLYFIPLSGSDSIPQAQGHAIKTHRHNTTGRNSSVLYVQITANTDES